MAIIAPLPVKDRDRVTGEETGDTMVLFKTVLCSTGYLVFGQEMSPTPESV